LASAPLVIPVKVSATTRLSNLIELLRETLCMAESNPLNRQQAKVYYDKPKQTID
jgi:hypothetical protein